MVALRADFYGRFAAYAGLAELLGANQVLVGPMQASELRRAVELPASRVGLRVEPELPTRWSTTSRASPCTAFSTALLELWQKRQDNTLTLAAYRESGVCTVPSRGWRRERTAGSRTSASRSCAR